MKKLLAILVMGSFVACNSGEETIGTVDSTSVEATTPAVVDTTTVVPVDTTGAGATTDTTTGGM